MLRGALCSKSFHPSLGLQVYFQLHFPKAMGSEPTYVCSANGDGSALLDTLLPFLPKANLIVYLSVVFPYLGIVRSAPESGKARHVCYSQTFT